MRSLSLAVVLLVGCSAPLAPVIDFVEPAVFFVDNPNTLQIFGKGFVPRVERAALADSRDLVVDASFMVRLIDDEGKVVIEEDGRWVDETVVEIDVERGVLDVGHYILTVEDPRGSVAETAVDAVGRAPSAVGLDGLIVEDPVVEDPVVEDPVVEESVIENPPVDESKRSPGPPIEHLDVALSADRTFVVWEQANEIWVEVFNGDLSVGVQSVATVGDDASAPKLAVFGTGRAVVAWADGDGVRARRVRPNGQLAGEEIAIATVAEDVAREVDVAPLSTGFVVTWDGPSVDEPLNARCFDASGGPTADEIRVSFFGIHEHALGQSGDDAIAVFRREETPAGLWTRTIRADCTVSNFPTPGMIDGFEADVANRGGPALVYVAAGANDDDVFFKPTGGSARVLNVTTTGDQRAPSFARGGAFVIWADDTVARGMPLDDLASLTADQEVELGNIDPGTVPRAAVSGDNLVVARVVDAQLVITRFAK